jgi:hypothetical protein
MLVSRVICQTNWNTRVTVYVVFQSIIYQSRMTSNGIAITGVYQPEANVKWFSVASPGPAAGRDRECTGLRQNIQPGSAHTP